MQVHVEVKSINAKFRDNGTHSLAYMAKKPFFAFLGCFFGIFKPKKPTDHLVFGLKFCMKMALELGKLYAKFGATSLMRLAVASLDILKCPKMQKFVPLIS